MSLSYPAIPGSKSFGTSSDAALSIADRAETLRSMVLEALSKCPMTADQCAALIGATPFACRPRFTELRRMGLITDTGNRGVNASGRNAIVWDVARKTFQPTLFEES